MPDDRPEPREIWISEVPVDDDDDSPFNHVVVVSTNTDFVLFRAYGSDQSRVLYVQQFLGTYNCTGAIEPDPDPRVGEVWRRRSPLAHGLFNEVEVVSTSLVPDVHYHQVRDRATGDEDYIPRERLVLEYDLVLDEATALSRVMSATSVEEIQVAMRPIVEAANQVMGALNTTLRQVPQAILPDVNGNLQWVKVGQMTLLDGSPQDIYSGDSGIHGDLVQAEVVLRGQVIGHVLIQETPREHPALSPTQWERLREGD